MKIKYYFWIVAQQNHFKKQTNETYLDKNDGTLNLQGTLNLLRQSLQSRDFCNSQ